jgi:hypothetical protein
MTSKGIIRTLDSSGDTVVAEWDLTEISLEEASKVFDQMVKEGRLLIRCDEGTQLTGEKIAKFDPLADEIQVMQQFVGG